MSFFDVFSLPKSSFLLYTAGILSFCLIGCSQDPTLGAEAKAASGIVNHEPLTLTSTTLVTKKPPQKQIPAMSEATFAANSSLTARKPNKTGYVYVPMFHHVGVGHGVAGIRSLYCTETQFTKFLTELDALGFRPVTAQQYVTKKMDLPKGATPVVMTFDDSNPDQLRMLSDGTVSPHCFVGLWMKFAKTHPEFPVHGTFFVLPKMMFGQEKFRTKKISLLKELGSELANHTIDHPFLSHLSTESAERQIGLAQLKLAHLGMPISGPMALPYGVAPRDKSIYKGFEYNGHKIHLDGVFLVGSYPAHSPYSANFNPYKINRIDGATTDMGLAYWLSRAKNHSIKLYVQG